MSSLYVKFGLFGKVANTYDRKYLPPFRMRAKVEDETYIGLFVRISRYTDIGMSSPIVGYRKRGVFRE